MRACDAPLISIMRYFENPQCFIEEIAIVYQSTSGWGRGRREKALTEHRQVRPVCGNKTRACVESWRYRSDRPAFQSVTGPLLLEDREHSQPYLA